MMRITTRKKAVFWNKQKKNTFNPIFENSSDQSKSSLLDIHLNPMKRSFEQWEGQVK